MIQPGHVQTDAEVFEITDFTVATDWERFVARLEAILQEWNVCGLDISKREATSTWFSRVERLTYEHASYTVELHSCLSLEPTNEQVQQTGQEEEHSYSDNSNPDAHLTSTCLALNNRIQSFASTLQHPLYAWFSLPVYVILRPEYIVIDTISQQSLHVSALSCAALNSGCEIPLFVAVSKPERLLFAGLAASRSTRVIFETVHLRNVHQRWMSLSGLLHIFKQRVMPAKDDSFTYAEQRCVVRVSVCQMFSCEPTAQRAGWLTPLESDSTTSFFDANEDSCKDEALMMSVNEVGHFAVGACSDTVIRSIDLFAAWLNLNEDMLVENEVYSDIDALSAPVWEVQVNFEDGAICSLSRALQRLLDLWDSDQSAVFERESTPQASNALSRLTEEPGLRPLSSVRRYVSHAVTSSRTHQQREAAPVNEKDLRLLITHMFPDAEKEPGDIPTSGLGHDSTRSETDESRLKTAGVDTVTSRVATVLFKVFDSMQATSALGYMWSAFLLELRYRFDNCIVLPLLEEGPPNLNCCHFHQELQLFNACICQKKSRPASSGGRKKREVKSRSVEEKQQDESNDWDWNEEETGTEGSDPDDFFDCEEDAAGSSYSSDDPTLPPEGRKEPFEDLRLVHRPDESLYVPHTQDPAPITERLLERQTALMCALGDSEAAMQQRARLQSASLISDMEAFKAANPGCCLEDFVRWFSPRDYVNGGLSERMRIPGNIWVDGWLTARAVAIEKQKRIFDDAKEAENILSIFNAAALGDVARYIAPIVFERCASALRDEVSLISSAAAASLFATDLEGLDSCLRLATQQHPAKEFYIDFLQIFKRLERRLARFRAVHSLLERHLNSADFETRRAPLLNRVQSLSADDLTQFVVDLLRADRRVAVLGAAHGPLGRTLQNIFAAHTALIDLEEAPTSPLPEAQRREYILQARLSCPSACSRTVPQRMYASVEKNSFRLALAQTQDITFF